MCVYLGFQDASLLSPFFSMGFFSHQNWTVEDEFLQEHRRGRIEFHLDNTNVWIHPALYDGGAVMVWEIFSWHFVPPGIN